MTQENTVAMTAAMFKTFDGPFKLGTGDDALYWTLQSNKTEAVTLKFLGLLDISSSSGKTKPYFNLEGLSSVSTILCIWLQKLTHVRSMFRPSSVPSLSLKYEFCP